MSPLLLLSALVQLVSEGSSGQRAVLLQLPPQVLQLSALPCRQLSQPLFFISHLLVETPPLLLQGQLLLLKLLLKSLFAQLPLPLTLLLLLPLQLLPELLALADVALRRPLVRLLQLRLVERPQLLQLLLVLRDQLLDLWLQP